MTFWLYLKKETVMMIRTKLLVDVIMMSASNANGEVTDEYSRDEEQVRPYNLPGAQLSAPTGIYSDNRNRDDDFDSEDEISLAELARELKE
ncbi:hypothetical protein HHI36_004698 [Cryptolaemus montrouzieri]|uniref:Uncharacterized protein n=1 Tax=Cryptolaemus montrouzieri TaxID=559131 RepID=A0ABD2NRY4_9CUCU